MIKETLVSFIPSAAKQALTEHKNQKSKDNMEVKLPVLQV